MSITLGATPVSNSGSGTNTVAATITGTTAGNSLIIDCAWIGSGTTITSITISGESNATLVGSPGTNASGNVATQNAYLATLTAGGSHTVTMNLSASSSIPEITVTEIVGANKASMVDNNGTFSSGAGTTTNSSTTLTTNNPNSAIFAVLQCDRSASLSAGAGYTALFTTSSFTKSEYQLDMGAAGSKTVAFTQGTAITAMSILAINLDPNVTISPSVGSLTLTGIAPTVTKANTITPTSGALTLTGFVPAVSGPRVTPNVGSLALTGFAPTITIPPVITPSVGSMGFTGFAPTVSVPLPPVFTSTGSMALTGFAPTLAVSVPPRLLLRTLNAYGTPGFSAPFDLLLRTLSASGMSGTTGAVSFTAPLRTIVASGNEGAVFTLPLRTLNATGVVGALGAVSFVTPLRSLAATGMMQVIASASFQTLLRSLSTLGVQGTIGSAAFTTPRRTLVANGLVGIAANAAFTTLLRTLNSTGYRAFTGTAQFSLPLRYLTTAGFPSVAENYRAWVMNARTGSLVEYDNFDFNSIVKFGNRYIASGPSGVYVLGGDDDAGVEIASTIRTGLPDYGSSFLKRLPRIYVSGTFEGEMTFSTISSEDGQRDYLLKDNGMTGEQQRRVGIGKGPKSVRWQLEIKNRDGAKFGISKVIVYPKMLGRRIQ